MGEIFEFLIYRPFSWLLVQLYTFTNSYTIAIVLFALITKVALIFFTSKGKLGMMRQQRLQPKLQALQKQYAGDKEKLNAETMKLYQSAGVSPMGGCLWTLLPWPVFIMLFSVIREPLTRLMGFQGTSAEVIERVRSIFNSSGLGEQIAHLSEKSGYPQLELAQIVHNNFAVMQANVTETLRDIDFSLFGTSLADVPKLPWQGFSWLCIIPVISAAMAYIQYVVSVKMSKMPENPQTKYMALLSPVMSLWFGFIMPSAMSIYWIANSVFQMAQDTLLTIRYNKVLDAEDARKAELEARRKEMEAKQKEEDRLRRAELNASKNKNSKKYKMTKHPKK